MTDDRTVPQSGPTPQHGPRPQHGPAPQYGEYATPEQQAAAMGREYVPPAPTPEGISPAGASATSGAEAVPRSGHFVDRFVTVLLLGVGVLSLLTSDWFHFAVNANVALAQAGIATRIPTAVDHYGWVLLGANILFLLATIAWASATLHRGRRAYYIPVLGYLAFTIVGGIFSYVVTR